MTTLFKLNHVSRAFKLASILITVLLSAAGLSAQTSAAYCKNKPVFIPTTVHYQHKNPAVLPLQSKTHTVLIARNFPVLESAKQQDLQAKENSEDMDYNNLFLKTAPKTEKPTQTNTLVLK